MSDCTATKAWKSCEISSESTTYIGGTRRAFRCSGRSQCSTRRASSVRGAPARHVDCCQLDMFAKAAGGGAHRGAGGWGTFRARRRTLSSGDETFARSAPTTSRFRSPIHLTSVSGSIDSVSSRSSSQPANTSD